MEKGKKEKRREEKRDDGITEYLKQKRIFKADPFS